MRNANTSILRSIVVADDRYVEAMEKVESSPYQKNLRNGREGRIIGVDICVLEMRANEF